MKYETDVKGLLEEERECFPIVNLVLIHLPIYMLSILYVTNTMNVFLIQGSTWCGIRRHISFQQ